jgi:two-component system cell cycle sensor histidine kinase PleC
MTAMALKLNATMRLDRDSSLHEGATRLMMDMQGRILFANNAFEQMAGQGHAEGLSFFDLATFEDLDDAFRHSPLLFAGEDSPLAALRSGPHNVYFREAGQSVQLQFDIIGGKNGARYVIASAMQDDRAFNDTVQNFINHKNEHDDELRPFLDLSSDLLIQARDDGTMIYLNDRFSDSMGFSLEDLQGRNFLDLVHPDDRAAVRSAMQNMYRGDTDRVIAFECRLISNQARTLWMEWKHRRIDGKIFSAGRDITNIKRHEQALLQRERQLSEAEAIGHMGHWHWTLGKEEIRFSDEIYRIFGVMPGKFTPTLDSVSSMMPRSDASRMMQVFQRAIIEQNDHEIDFCVRTPAGGTRYVRCQGRCEFDAKGEVTGLYGIMQDVTQTHSHERALMEAKESAERAYSTKSQFLANMSHELRTPLNAIIGFSEMIQQQLLGPIGNEKYLDYIKGIRESGEHLLDLITDILDMSKLEAGKYELDLDELNLAKTIRLAIHMMEGRAMESGIKISLKMQDESMQIVADRRAVMQVMLNLLSNAVKFSHPNGAIEVECVGKDGFVSIRVKDNGVGIPANKLPTITNPFEQVANQYSRGHEGSGLGLSITKELVGLHGGSIHIESQINVGTTVSVRLPNIAVTAR